MYKLLSFFMAFTLLNTLQACNRENPDKEKLVKNSVAFFNNGKYKEAISGLDSLIAMDSSDYVSWAYKGWALFLEKQDNEALTALNRSLTINPEYDLAYSYRAALYQTIKCTDLAIKDINKALEQNANDTSFLLIRAGIYNSQKDFEHSAADCNTILAIAPANTKAFYLRAKANEKLGNKKQALEDFNHAHKLSPGDASILNDRGFFFIEQEKFLLAAPDFTEVIRLADKDTLNIAYAYNNRGFCLYKSGKIPEALADVNQSIRLMHENSYAHKNRALILIAMKQIPEACKEISTSLALGYTEKYGDEAALLQQRYCK